MAGRQADVVGWEVDAVGSQAGAAGREADGVGWSLDGGVSFIRILGGDSYLVPTSGRILILRSMRSGDPREAYEKGFSHQPTKWQAETKYPRREAHHTAHRCLARPLLTQPA